jgi:uncharacterized membrane protein
MRLRVIILGAVLVGLVVALPAIDAWLVANPPDPDGLKVLAAVLAVAIVMWWERRGKRKAPGPTDPAGPLR